MTAGEVVQLRLALEGLDLLPSTDPPHRRRLAALTAAWATLYHYPDPAASDSGRFRFTEALCRARISPPPQPFGLAGCIRALERSLVDDLLGVVRAYQRAGHPDKIGEHRLSEIAADLVRRQRERPPLALPTGADPSHLELPVVSRCRPGLPPLPMLAASRHRIRLNGFPLLGAPDGLAALKPQAFRPVAQALQIHLTASLPAEQRPVAPTQGPRRDSPTPRPIARARGAPPLAPPGLGGALRPRIPARAAAAPELSCALDRRLGQPVLSQLLGQVASLGIRRVCLAAESSSAFRTPCCVSVLLSPRIGTEGTVLRLRASVVTVEQPGHPAKRLADGARGFRQAQRLGLRVVRLGSDASWALVVRWLSALGSSSGGLPELVLDLPARSPQGPRAGP